MDNGGQFEEHVLLHGVHLGPVLDVGAVAESLVGVRLAVAVEYAALVDLGVEGVGFVFVGIVNVGSGGDYASVGGRSGDGACVHEGYEGNLSVAGLGTFAVGEVTCGVAYGEAVVGGDVACTEAGTAEGGFDYHTGFEELLGHAVARRRHVYGHALRVSGDGEVVVADALSLEDGSGLGEVVVCTARATGYDTLVGHYLAVADFTH